MEKIGTMGLLFVNFLTEHLVVLLFALSWPTSLPYLRRPTGVSLRIVRQ